MTDSIAARLRRALGDGRGVAVTPTRAVNAGDAAIATAAPSSSLVRLAVAGAENTGAALRDRANNWNWQRQIRQNLGPYVEPLARMDNVSGTCTLDIRFGNVFEITLSGNTAIALASFPVPAGIPCSAGITLIVNNPGGYDLSWPGEVSPMDDTETTVAAGTRVPFVLLTTNNGATWDLMSAGPRTL